MASIDLGLVKGEKGDKGDTGSPGTTVYTDLTNKPSINGVTLTGNKTADNLSLQAKLTAGENITIDANNVISASGGGGGTSDYTDLTNKPSINNVTLVGNKTGSDLGLGDVPVGSIVQFDGNTIPTGYEEVNGFENYSTTEQRIGTWINGKPLYEITIETTVPTVTTDGTEAQVNIDILGSDMAFILNGYVKYVGSAKTFWTMPYYNNSNRYVKSLATFIGQTNAYRCIIASNGTVYNNSTAYLVVRYTKTTDSAS